jgi:hypothetical protein
MAIPPFDFLVSHPGLGSVPSGNPAFMAGLCPGLPSVKVAFALFNFVLDHFFNV